MTQPRRKHRLYAPFQVIKGENGRKRYIRLTYEVYNPLTQKKQSKTFAAAVKEVAIRRYQDLLIWGVWPGSPVYKDPGDGRRNMSIELRPVPKAEQPALV